MKNTLTVAEYLHNKDIRKNGLYIPRDCITIIKGNKYTEDELNKAFPIHLPILTGEKLRLLKGSNPDKTKV